MGTAFVETHLFHGDTLHKASAEAIGSGMLMELGLALRDHVWRH